MLARRGHREHMKGKRGTKKGDIIALTPQRFVSEYVWVESISDSKIAEKMCSGSFAIFVGKRKNGIVVMTETGLLGWIYNDEWQPL